MIRTTAKVVKYLLLTALGLVTLNRLLLKALDM